MNMRQKVQRLNKYQLFSLFKFVDLLYLAQFYQQKTFNYKQYLFKQQQVPNQIFLIQEGDFQFNKIVQDKQQLNKRNKLKQKAQRIRNKSKQKILPTDFQQTSAYNTAKLPKLRQSKIGQVSGGLGQTIGQQQIICQKQRRKYNVKCISTNNKVIVIKKQNFQKILRQNPSLHSYLKQKYKQKSKIVQNYHKNIQSTRSNLQSFVKILHKQKSPAKYHIDQSQDDTHPQHDNHAQLKLPSLAHRKNNTQIEKKKSRSIHNWSKVKNLRFSQQNLVNKQKREEKQIQKYPQQLDSSTFALTSFQPYTKSHFQHQNQKQIQINKTHQDLQTEVLNDSIPLKASKSWNNRQLSPKKILPKQKYLGMIDSSTLIRQKQHILSLRRDANSIDDRTQFQQRQKYIYKQMQIQKQKGRQTTAAHSKQYMQKMLLNALRKAGYQQSISMLSPKNTKRQKNITDDDCSFRNQFKVQQQGTIVSETRSLKRQKITNKLKRRRKQFFDPIYQVLESNPFDQCYFGKMK